MRGDLSKKSNNEPQTSSAGTFALAYVAIGHPVFPCRATKKLCDAGRRDAPPREDLADGQPLLQVAPTAGAA